MDQDGKVDHVAQASEVDTSTGSLMLTLCTKSDAEGYWHAVIPFPPSYEAACAEALKTFSAYIPADTEAVSLRQAIRRKDGQYVWSIIREDVWANVVKKSGEEVGVFLPDASPKIMLYNHQPPSTKKLISLRVGDNPDGFLKLIRSLHDLKVYAQAISELLGWRGYQMKFDNRMVGSRAERQAYREEASSSSLPAVWSLLSDPELFEFLLGLYPEPMHIQMVPTQLHSH